ncbi:AMP-binding protein [Roseibium salinum]|nr:AMP-binding protein [Roseibium salinum]
MAAKRAELTPEAVAFTDHDTGRSFTFCEVNSRASRLGNLLLDRGLGKGDRAAVLCLNHPDFFVLLFAAQKTGIQLVPLNWRQPVAELAPILEASGARVLFHDGDCAETAGDLVSDTGIRLLPLGATRDAGSALDALLRNASPAAIGCGRIRADAPWYLLFTSGTTGLPKAVIQTAGMAYANMINYSQATGLTVGEKGVNFLPLFHTAGINLPTLPIFLNGGSSTVLRKFDADRDSGSDRCGRGNEFLWRAGDLSGAGAFTQDWQDGFFSGVRSLGCGGAPVPRHLLNDFRKRGVTICNGMGMTETGPTVFLMDKAHAAEKNRLGRQAADPDRRPARRR